MGNVASSSRGAGGGLSGNGGHKSDAASANIDNSPLAFHNVHGENIRYGFVHFVGAGCARKHLTE